MGAIAKKDDSLEPPPLCRPPKRTDLGRSSLRGAQAPDETSRRRRPVCQQQLSLGRRTFGIDEIVKKTVPMTVLVQVIACILSGSDCITLPFAINGQRFFV